jgi:hypothetical protein
VFRVHPERIPGATVVPRLLGFALSSRRRRGAMAGVSVRSNNRNHEGGVIMDEPKGPGPREAQRAAAEATRKMQETTKDAARAVTRLADRGAQTSAALTEANQRVMNEFMGLSMETFQETARLFFQMQQNTMEMMREGQAAALRAQMAWPEAFKDPLRWYQSVCQESMEGARKAFDVVNGTSEALTESVSRLQASTQQAGTKIESAITTAATRMKDVA